MHTSDEWGGNINDIAMSTLHLSTTREQVGSKSHEQIHGTMSDNFEEADRESETFLDSGHALRDSTSQRAHTSLNPAILANPTTEVDDKRSRREGRKSRWMNFVTFRNRRSECPILTERQPSPETEAGFFSLLTFQWMASLMQVGYARSLDLTDIWQVNPHRSVPVMRARLSASFERRMQSGDKNSLRNAIYDTFRKEFLFGGFHSFAASILQVLSPFALRYLIQFVADAYTASRGGLETPPISHGIAWVIGITLMQILQTLCFNHFLYRGMLIGGQSRAVLIALIFDKATKLSGRARVGGSSQEMPPSEIKLETEEGRRWMRKRIGRIRATKGQPGWSEGRIMNLMSMDTSRINQGSIMIHSLWTSPVSICLALALLLVNITYSALPGVALLLLVIPLLAKAVKVMLARRKAITPITDLRVTLTQEILQSVRFVKYFGWDSAFLDRLDEIRKQELSRTRAMLTIRHAVTAIGTSMSTFAAMLAFITYALSGHQLTSSRVFSSLSLFGALSMPLNQLPQVLGHVTDAAHSISRIQDFLLAEEAEDPVDWDFDNENAIVLKKAKFVWEQNDGRESDNDAIDNRSTSKQSQRIEQTTKQTRDHAERHSETSGKSPIKPESSTGPAHSKDSVRYPFTLGELSLTVGHHELVAIIGIVGSGKSSLLAALAGDMRKIAGSITLGASRSFCSQSAWIQNASVKENIIFGKNKETSGSVAVNDDWYNKVLDACDLRSDMEAFPFGDMTELGERGINLSGGQRQRLDLARAIYSDAGLVLMDDPLSAVDASVGRHIMDNAICGLLKDRCRIIATHQLHILHRCDRVIYLDGGRIIADGTFVDLMVHSLPFQKIMANDAHEDDRDLFEKVGEQVDELEGKQKTMTQSQAALMQVEERPVRSVSWSVYAAYVRASGTMLNIPLVLFLLVASQGAGVSTGLWLSWWTSNKFGYSLGIYVSVYFVLHVLFVSC
jgi:ATP-binding cassette subfamily C (CFTR/MRP) protein 1